jgi:hypothetical protein
MRARAVLVLRSVVTALVLCGLSAAAVGCASYAVIPDDARARLDAAHTGELVFLKQSMYAGQI